MHVRPCPGYFPEGGGFEGLPIFAVLGDEVAAGILGQSPIFLEMIDLGDEPARCRNPRIFQVLGVFPDLEGVELVVRQIDAEMALGAFALAREYRISLQRFRRKSTRVPVQEAVERGIA